MPWSQNYDPLGAWPLSTAVAALPVVGEALALCGSAAIYKAAVARCFHVPSPAEVDFLVEHDYPERTGPAARAAWLASTCCSSSGC